MEAELSNPIWEELLREFAAAVADEGYGLDEEGRVVPLDPSSPATAGCAGPWACG